MSDFKSKLPDLNELGSMASKLFNGIKNSVQEIVHDYKQKRAENDAVVTPAEEVKPEVKPAEPTESKPKE